MTTYKRIKSEIKEVEGKTDVIVYRHQIIGTATIVYTVMEKTMGGLFNSTHFTLQDMGDFGKPGYYGPITTRIIPESVLEGLSKEDRIARVHGIYEQLKQTQIRMILATYPHLLGMDYRIAYDGEIETQEGMEE